MCSSSSMAMYTEAFSFLTHEREDVQKMATHGLAAQSKDNVELCAFLVSKPHGHRGMHLLLQDLHIGRVPLLGDLLTLLINCSVDAKCAELMVEKNVIRKAMRLLDSLSLSSLSLPSQSLVHGLQELTLMLLNNLTSSYIIAVDEFLQKEDEDMRGFYLGKLQAFYHAAGEERKKTETEADHEEQLHPDSKEKWQKGKKEEEEENEEKTNPVSSGESAATRDIQRWMLQIVLNLSRCVDGQEQILSDEQWQEILLQAMDSPLPSHRLLAAQVFRNCACGSHPFFPLVVKGGGLLRAVQRLTDCGTVSSLEREPEIAQCLADFVASMLESEEGVAQLESVNAKKLFSAVVTRSLGRSNERSAPSRSVTDASSAFGKESKNLECRVEELHDTSEEKVGSKVENEECATKGEARARPSGMDKASPVLNESVAEFIEQRILCHLDDIIDAYLAPGSDELD